MEIGLMSSSNESMWIGNKNASTILLFAEVPKENPQVAFAKPRFGSEPVQGYVDADHCSNRHPAT